ncbi:MAG: cbb3-type cytochrome c oxidase subunit 3 [Candidatus Parabeggiatoa sp.]|nr:cbb3-type cytochrome c oxidase subunit 3 [Candidatus Parabeggiatoa sp.]
MDIVALFQSIWTIVVMIVFLSIVVWAYSSKRKSAFDEAAHLPLDDDDSVKSTVKEKHHV